MGIDVIQADVIEWAKAYDGPRFHSLLSDPPYSLNFMGKNWDNDIAFRPETWAVLKDLLLPGAFGMAFAASRGWHRMAVAIEDAGFVFHPSVFMYGFSYGSGFPKATRIDTQIDKAAGAEREVVGKNTNVRPSHLRDDDNSLYNVHYYTANDAVTAPATPLAQAWAGHRYGLQALKPALEPIIVFQKPYEGRPVECITETGAGALWIEGGRIPTDGRPLRGEHEGNSGMFGMGSGFAIGETTQGRWPANFVLDAAAAERLDELSGELKSGGGIKNPVGREGLGWKCSSSWKDSGYQEPSSGGASRFFFRYVADALDEADPVYYCAKASRRERDAGLDDRPLKTIKHYGQTKNNGSGNLRNGDGSILPSRNPHPTVKPIALARYLATLLLPPAEYAPRRILVPFAGAGSEMIGAYQAGWEEVTGIEMEQEYAEIARARLEYWANQKPAQVQMELEI